jgi:hypothetical protein
LRWTTRPSNRYWPIALFQEEHAVNKDQVARIGTFAGTQTFDLFIESHATVRPDQVFGIEVAVSVEGVIHTLTSRCQRRGNKD